MAGKNTQVTKTRRTPSRRRDSLIVHCLSRAMIAAKGWDETQEQFDAGTLKVSNWAAVKASRKATRVGGFILSWAIAMRGEGRDEYTITEYQRHWRLGEREAYRLQQEFRELWPEFETPNELAQQIVKHVNAKPDSGKSGKIPLSVPVFA